MRNVEPRVNSCCSRLESEPHAHYSGRELPGNNPQQRVNSDNKREPKRKEVRENRKEKTKEEKDHHANGPFLESASQKEHPVAHKKCNQAETAHTPQNP